MLTELRIENLGVIETLDLVLPGGSIAITGETGAGKTMVVGAIQLLAGGRAEPDMVRVGAVEAIVEGRFVDTDGIEVVVRRVVPADGRSRAYLDGSLATASALAERIGPLVDLHGQHSHQSLLRPETQRRAVDRYGRVDTSALVDARTGLAAVEAALADLGGDATERARRIDLLRYQLDELRAADVSDPTEDEALADEESRLAGALEVQVSAAEAAELTGSDGPGADALARAAAVIGDSPAFAEVAPRLRVLQDELSSLSLDLRSIGERSVDDPERREEIRHRRQLLVELRRKYGPALTDVIAYADDVAGQLTELESHESTVAALQLHLEGARAELTAAEQAVAEARRAVAEPLARAVEAELTHLAMPDARVEVRVDGTAGDDISILLAPNPGMPALPVGKSASGGELSRTMLALRLVLSGGPPVKVFDEVDAGVGGAAAHAVGAALARIGGSSQSFVVTHLPQVASQADHHVVITKHTDGGGTRSQARLLSDDERVVEVSRLLSGSPDSESARRHARELLDAG